MDGTTAVVLVLLGTFVSKFMDFLKFLRARDTNGVVTQLGTWCAGIVGVLLLSATEWGDRLVLEGVSMADTDLATKVFAGLMVTSLLSKVYDFQKARDSTQTAATPSLVPGTGVVNTTTGHAAATTTTPSTTPPPATPAPHPTT